jgi:hypothetical protein
VKPISVLYYNKSMIGVDLKDPIASFVFDWEKTNKWYMKIFRRLLNI